MDTQPSSGTPGLDVRVSYQDDEATLSLSGELDIATAPAVRSHFNTLDEHRTVVLDLAGVTFIDSSGLGLILECQGQAAAKGASLILRNPGPQAQRLFEVAGVRQALHVEEPESPQR